jgi:hypothetical protein
MTNEARAAAEQLHQAIMNIPCSEDDGLGSDPWDHGYKHGHKAARHAAAELLMETLAAIDAATQADKQRIVELEARINAVDCEELDATDGAHPAWWRGHEHTAKVFCQLINEILDGNHPIGGVSNEPWESTKKRLQQLTAELTATRQRAETAEAELERLKRGIERAYRDRDISSVEISGQTKWLAKCRGGALKAVYADSLTDLITKLGEQS